MNRLTPGLVLGERYRLEGRIASGGMADVWAAQDEVLQRMVALKVMRPDPDHEELFALRFRDEALHSAALIHTNIATVFDYGEDDGPGVPGHGARRRQAAVAADPRARPTPRRPGAFGARPVRSGPRRRTSGQACPPRREAGQHPGPRGRPGEAHRLRHRPCRRRLGTHPRRRPARHAGLHQPGAGARPAGDRRIRPLRPRRRRARDAVAAPSRSTSRRPSPPR